MPELQSHCNRVIFWTQYGPTCWFNAVLIAIFYSQHSRNMLYDLSSKWDKNIELFKMLRFVLKHKYLKSKNPEKDFKFFDMLKPERILDKIHEIKPKYAYADMGLGGHHAEMIIGRLYKLLGVDCLMFQATDSGLYYDMRNNIEYEELLPSRYNPGKLFYLTTMKVKERIHIDKKLNKIKNPQVIIVNNFNKNWTSPFYIKNPHYGISTDNNMLLTLNNTVMYNGVEYVLDSVLINNWNIAQFRTAKRHNAERIPGHEIVGITCGNERYVYNG